MIDLIGLCGKARVGKDSIADFLGEFNYKKFHFADALYEECREAKIVFREWQEGDVQRMELTIHGEEYDDPRVVYPARDWILRRYTSFAHDEEDTRHFYTGMDGKDAELLQWWGTEFRRNLFGDTYWIDRLAATLAALDKKSVAVIADVRFRNEAQWIKEAGGSLWRIQREEPLEDIGRDATHASETNLDHWRDWDQVVDNDGTLDELKHKINGIMAYKSLGTPSAVKIMQRESRS